MTVVDAGCGAGRLAHLGTEVGMWLGYDLSPDMVARAKAEHARDNARFAVADMTDLPVESGTADVTVSALVLGHLPPDAFRAAIGEMARVTKRDGYIVLDEVHPHGATYGALLQLPDSKTGEYIPKYAHWHSAYTDALRDFGLEVEAAYDLLYTEEVLAPFERGKPRKVLTPAYAGVPGNLAWVVRVL